MKDSVKGFEKVIFLRLMMTDGIMIPGMNRNKVEQQKGFNCLFFGVGMEKGSKQTLLRRIRLVDRHVRNGGWAAGRGKDSVKTGCESRQTENTCQETTIVLVVKFAGRLQSVITKLWMHFSFAEGSTVPTL